MYFVGVEGVGAKGFWCKGSYWKRFMAFTRDLLSLVPFKM